MRECYSCRENDRSWSLSLYYKCKSKFCENYYVEIKYTDDKNEYDECFLKYF